MKLTPAQDRAIHTDGIDLCVRAGAGSGKTRVLVERAVRLLTREEDPLSLSQILAITFTEKAAREMKERLADELAARRGPAARSQVQWAYVSTIHGFCARLLRENAIEARLDPAFEVMDEVRAGAMLDLAFDDVAERWVREEPEQTELVARIDATDLREPILGLYSLLRAAGEAASGMRIPEVDPARVENVVEGILLALDQIPAVLDMLPLKSVEKAQAAMDHRDAVAGLRPDTPFQDARAVLDGLRSAINLSVKADLKEITKPLKNEALPGAIGVFAELFARPALLALRAFLVELDQAYSRAKVEAGVLDFSDLEGRAHDLLACHEDVRETVRRRFRQLLVDEVQDVNPLQERIIRLLRIEGGHFAVGDVKQSIYGFRHADPALFKAYAEEVGEAGLVSLDANFRSRPGLVEFANQAFGGLFGGSDLVDFSPMEALGDYECGEGEDPSASDVEVMLVSGEAASDFRELEAQAIAARIREIVDGDEVRLRRAGERHGQPVSYRDMAILFRALSDVKTYERALEDHDVPYYVVKGGGFYQAREIVDLARLLRVVTNPRDEISLAATLRSPFAAVTEDALLALAAARPREGRLSDLLADPEAVAGLAAADRARWISFACLFARLRTLAARAPIRAVIETALEESGYATSLWLLPGARRHHANVVKALSLADSFEGATDLGGFVDALEDLRGKEIRETEAPTGGEAEDVVQLLTVHGAKGLEFPVVFLPDLSRSPPGQTPRVIYGVDGAAIRVRAPGGAVPTAAHLAGKEALARREEAESLRLLYVAVTRAEERLVLSARDAKARGASWWGALSGVLAVDDSSATLGSPEMEIPVRRITEVAEGGVRRRSLARRHEAALVAGKPLGIADEDHLAKAERLIARTDLERPAPSETCFQNTISELLLFSDCPLCYRDRYILGIPAPQRVSRLASIEDGSGEGGDGVDAPGADEFPATDRGIAVHEVLRAYDPSSGLSLGEVARDRLAPRVGQDAPAGLIDEVVGVVRRFYASDIGREVLAAEPSKVRREVPFFVRWPVPDGPDLLLRGQIDLLFPGPDGRLRVLDYKTGGSPPERYEVQITAYAHALSRFVSEGVGSAGLVYLDASPEPAFHPVAVDERSRQRVDRAAWEFSRLLSGKTPWPGDHAEGCSGGRGSGARAWRSPALHGGG